jgi:hypothetical protein
MILSFAFLGGVEVLRKRDDIRPVQPIDVSSTTSTVLVAGVSMLEIRVRLSIARFAAALHSSVLRPESVLGLTSAEPLGSAITVNVSTPTFLVSTSDLGDVDGSRHDLVFFRNLHVASFGKRYLCFLFAFRDALARLAATRFFCCCGVRCPWYLGC